MCLIIMFSVHLLPCSQNTMCSFDNPWDEGPSCILALIARLMRSTWGPRGADMTQVGPILAPWTLLSGCISLCCPHWFRFLLSIDFMHHNQGVPERILARAVNINIVYASLQHGGIITSRCFSLRCNYPFLPYQSYEVNYYWTLVNMHHWC